MDQKYKKGFTVLECIAAIFVFSIVCTLAINSFIRLSKNYYYHKNEIHYLEFVQESYYIFNDNPKQYYLWLERHENLTSKVYEETYKEYWLGDIKIRLCLNERTLRLFIDKKGYESYAWKRYL